jgi:acyl-[acyl-carrier-protein]-phospholipid O-acyltransferase/long-chain-fatty-acid--[acyl-carrier-protein] ligase
LLISQFLGAFNDNAWKLFIVLLALQGISLADPAAREAAYQHHTTVGFVVFTLCNILFSIPAGLLSDRKSKRSVIVWMKGIEILLMGAGALFLRFNPAGQLFLLTILGLMGAHSALFAPAKYGILPEILPHDKLSYGNGLLQLWTFVAIIAGTCAGGMLRDLTGNQPWLAGGVLTLLAFAGWVAALQIPRTRAARSEGNLLRTLQMGMEAMRADRVLKLAVIGSVFFWTIASLLGQDIVVYAKAALELSDFWAGTPLALFAVGTGLGSVWAGRVSKTKVEYGLIPLGAIGLTLFTLLFGLLGPALGGSLLMMTLLGLSSGFVVVPLQALLQWRAPADLRGAVLALANLFSGAGLLVGSMLAYLFSKAGLSSQGIFTATSIGILGATVWALWLLPSALVRLVLVLLTHTLYRLKTKGREHLPQEGGALLVPNHVSFVDGLLILATTDRPVRFLVDSSYFHHKLLYPFMKAFGAIPLSSSGGPRVILKAMREAGSYLDRGNLVCIFAEGQITRTGTLLPFRRGLERIVEGRTTPIIPVYLDRVWGSIFSYSGGRFVTKLPERIPYPVTVAFGKPLPSDTPFQEVRSAVQALGELSWQDRKSDRPPLHRSFIRACRRSPFRMAFADASHPRLSRIGALAGTMALARTLRTPWKDQTHVGILLPPSVAAVLSNIAAAMAGKTSVNLNYTAGPAGIGSAIRQAGLRTVVTSRTFLEKAGIELPGEIEPIWIDEITPSIHWFTRLLSLVWATIAPASWIERWSGATRPIRPDDVATVIFSSGSTGEPKGVELTHFNIDSNVEACAQIFRLQPNDRILGILPLFHSFGYMGTLWLSANHGMGTVFHPSPLDAAAIGELVQRYRVTFLLATPTFLQLYMRRCTPAQFGSLRVVLAGAEKLSESFAQAFEEAFGIRPLEGYGATECSPVIATSTLDFRAPGFFQPGSRRGFVGQALPGVTVKIVAPDTFVPCPYGEAGMLLVKGPNVMRGYLGRPDLTSQAIRDGWYVTGDIAMIDQEGFIKITDRLSRFSKIGGEMVPHGRVEQALQEAAGVQMQAFAVTAVPDEKKGERLAVLHTLEESRIPEILEKLAANGLPNLLIPRRENFIEIDALPLLGTGKLDLRRVKQIAVESSKGT